MNRVFSRHLGYFLIAAWVALIFCSSSPAQLGSLSSPSNKNNQAQGAKTRQDSEESPTLQEVVEASGQLSIEIPFPQRDIHIRSTDADSPEVSSEDQTNPAFSTGS